MRFSALKNENIKIFKIKGNLKMKVDPDYKSIGALFRDANVFSIPKYQRGYAWKENQLEDFIEDIKALLIEGEQSEHFFGSLVCSQVEAVGGHERENQLVDGQQRLTTFVILASRLIRKYEELIKLDSDHVEYINQKIQELTERYICYKKSVNKKTELIPRMTLSRRDKEFFASLIDGRILNCERESHNKLKFAADKIDKFIEELVIDKSIDEQLDSLGDIEKIINEKCNIIHMITSKVSDAYKLFQVINDRGEHLTHTDLIRAKTLGIADDNKSEHIFKDVEKTWDDLDRDLGLNLEKLLGDFYSSKTGDKVKPTAFYDQFVKKIIGESSVLPEHIYQLMSDLKIELRKAHQISNGEWPYADSKLNSWKRNRLRILVINLKHTHPIPLLLAATKLDESKFYELVRVLEVFFFRYKHICKNKIDLATTRYLKACRLIESGDFIIQKFKEELRGLILKDATDEQFAIRIAELQYIDPKKGDNRGLRYLLMGLEDSWSWYIDGMKGGYSNKEKSINVSAVYEFSSMTLEHVYPQNPSVKDLNIEEHLNSLGNLTLLDPSLNSSLGNLDYSEKYSFLVERSKLAINSDFANYPSWNRENLLDRQKRLIDAAKSVFSF